jgi:hypothetical protein
MQQAIQEKMNLLGVSTILQQHWKAITTYMVTMVRD